MATTYRRLGCNAATAPAPIWAGAPDPASVPPRPNAGQGTGPSTYRPGFLQLVFDGPGTVSDTPLQTFPTAPLKTLFDGLTLMGLCRVLDSLGLCAESVFLHLGSGCGALAQLVATRYKCRVLGIDSHVGLARVAKDSTRRLQIDRCTFHHLPVPSSHWMNSRGVTHIWCYDFRLPPASWSAYNAAVKDWATLPRLQPQSRPKSSKTAARPTTKLADAQEGAKSGATAQHPYKNEPRSGRGSTKREAPDKSFQRQGLCVVSCFGDDCWAPGLSVVRRHAEPYNDGSGRVLLLHILEPWAQSQCRPPCPRPHRLTAHERA
jgi:hypothetical protein